jgi:hypothetical protein
MKEKRNVNVADFQEFSGVVDTRCGRSYLDPSFGFGR